MMVEAHVFGNIIINKRTFVGNLFVKKKNNHKRYAQFVWEKLKLYAEWNRLNDVTNLLLNVLNETLGGGVFHVGKLIVKRNIKRHRQEEIALSWENSHMNAGLLISLDVLPLLIPQRNYKNHKKYIHVWKSAYRQVHGPPSSPASTNRSSLKFWNRHPVTVNN